LYTVAGFQAAARVTGLDDGETGDEPFAFVATTVTVYFPGGTPVKVDVVAPAAAVAVMGLPVVGVKVSV